MSKLCRDRSVLDKQGNHWYNGAYQKDINMKFYALEADFYGGIHDLEAQYGKL